METVDDLRSLIRGELDKITKPIAEAERQRQAGEIAREVKADIVEFAKRHPDWKTHEAEMTRIGTRLQPGKNATTLAYMEDLYRLATHDISEADRTARVVNRLNKSAKEAEPRNSAVPESAVSPTSSKPLSLEESFDLAIQGKTVE